MCKSERFNNCDEETRNQEYCIFHKPKKDEKEAREFYEKFLVRFKPKKEKVWDNWLRIEIERFVFEEAVDCKGYVFPIIPKSDFSFNRSIFKHDAWFDKATFEGDVQFNEAMFEGDAWFDKATFKGNVRFIKATFKGDARFSRATFERDAGFHGTMFKGNVWFNEAMFEGNAGFRLAMFEGNVWFDKAMFKENVQFSGATFERDAEFHGTMFKGDAWFDEATFEGMAHFRGKISEKEYKFCGELDFSNAEFRKGIDIDIPSEWFRLPKAEAEACRVQRIFYEREGRRDKADEMFMRERRALRKSNVEEAKTKVREAKKSNSLENTKSKLDLIKVYGSLLKAVCSSIIEILLADWTCKYGTEWKRPVFLWILVVFVLSPILYLFPVVSDVNINSLSDYLFLYLDYLYFSISNVTPFSYRDLHLIGLQRIVAAAEAIFGTFMWAVFLAVFARKYMR